MLEKLQNCTSLHKYKLHMRVEFRVSYYYYYLHYYYYFFFLSQAYSSWQFSWTNSDPHRSGFKLHTAVLSVLCVMFQV
jgi:hypothetical protein